MDAWTEIQDWSELIWLIAVPGALILVVLVASIFGVHLEG
jgi:hypothetical protein